MLKIEKNDLKYFAWSDLNPIYGDEIYAAGFPLGNPEFTLLDGIITKQKADGENQSRKPLNIMQKLNRVILEVQLLGNQTLQ